MGRLLSILIVFLSAFHGPTALQAAEIAAEITGARSAVSPLEMGELGSAFQRMPVTGLTSEDSGTLILSEAGFTEFASEVGVREPIDLDHSAFFRQLLVEGVRVEVEEGERRLYRRAQIGKVQLRRVHRFHPGDHTSAGFRFHSYEPVAFQATWQQWHAGAGEFRPVFDGRWRSLLRPGTVIPDYGLIPAPPASCSNGGRSTSLALDLAGNFIPVHFVGKSPRDGRALYAVQIGERGGKALAVLSGIEAYLIQTAQPLTQKDEGLFALPTFFLYFQRDSMAFTERLSAAVAKLKMQLNSSGLRQPAWTDGMLCYVELVQTGLQRLLTTSH